MKEYTQQEIKGAKKIAWHYLTGTSFIVLRHPFKYDARTRIGNLSAKFVRELKGLISPGKIRDLRRTRALNKPTAFVPIAQHPLVKDYLKNRGYLKTISTERLCFHGGRNHWARDKKDIRILQLLIKHLNKKSL